MNLPDFLTKDNYGYIHLAGHRIGLYDIVCLHQDGYSAEMLVDEFPTIKQAPLIYRQSGDKNPLHFDPDTARAAGFPRLSATLDHMMNRDPDPGVAPYFSVAGLHIILRQQSTAPSRGIDHLKCRWTI